ncbi:uncharacterized protein LOC113203388 [Frankliniella occidentalis]|uniref:Uncharacterized protein LOC113203388 n=1 Tax=Frankliniella occidentalis TaxID=133901 RepID=A0A6J1S3S2_FRAOC|nr:uncharacterized protein LOC113203388 [Frankliniella occidentalis]
MDPVETSALTLKQLPDDVLVMVMQYVSMKDVLECRLVCKRFCGLALHRDVWRHRSLEDEEPCAGAVLHLAPCLNTLTWLYGVRVPTLALTTTRCSVVGLILHSDKLASHAPQYAMAVRNQESFGRLRRLELHSKNPLPDELLRTVASCSHLESLDVEVPSISHPVVYGPPMPSLKKFRCPLNENTVSFVHTILVGHAATLEVVDLWWLTSGTNKTTTATLLAALPRLRALFVGDSMMELEAVAACNTLRDVDIGIYDRNHLERTAEFFRRAHQLRRVSLYNNTGDDTPEVCSVLLDGLVSSGQSRVERLAFLMFENMRPLLGVLPSLPALRHLELDLQTQDPDDELLKGITPVTAPALRLLKIAVSGCAHAWIHGDTAKALIAKNPSLHIEFWLCEKQVWCKCADDTCRTLGYVPGCHQEVNWLEVCMIGLYSHDPNKCPSPEYHTAYTNLDRSYHDGKNVACTWIHV